MWTFLVAYGWIVFGILAVIFLIRMAILLLPALIVLMIFIGQMIFSIISTIIVGLWFVVDRDSAYASMIRHRYRTRARHKTI